MLLVHPPKLHLEIELKLLRLLLAVVHLQKDGKYVRLFFHLALRKIRLRLLVSGLEAILMTEQI
jgi:hypothetical protein